MPEAPPEHNLVKIDNLTLNPAIPKIYANGFAVGFTASDAYVVLQLNNIPVAVINLSLITTKTLQKSLNKAMESFEQNTGVQLKDIFELQELLQIPKSK